MPLTSTISSLPTVIPTSSDQTTKPTENAILVLKSRYSLEKPGFLPELSKAYTYVIDNNGDATQAKFKYTPGTNVFLACGLTWENKYYVFGGVAQNMLQISQGASLFYPIFYWPFQVVMDSWSDWKLELVGELSTEMIMPQCAVMQKKIYLCFWSDSSKPYNRSYQRCVSAKGPLKVFTDIGTSSLYPHRADSQQLASNDRKCILKSSKKSFIT